MSTATGSAIWGSGPSRCPSALRLPGRAGRPLAPHHDRPPGHHRRGLTGRHRRRRQRRRLRRRPDRRSGSRAALSRGPGRPAGQRGQPDLPGSRLVARARGRRLDGDGSLDAIIGSNFGGSRLFLGNGHRLLPDDRFPLEFPELAGGPTATASVTSSTASSTSAVPAGRTIRSGDRRRLFLHRRRRHQRRRVQRRRRKRVVFAGMRVYFGARTPCPSSHCTRFVPRPSWIR